MAKTNFKTLEDNKKGALAFALEIAMNEAKSITRNDIKDKLQSAIDALDKKEFSKSVMLLDEIKDNKLGIVWHTSGDLGNGTKSRVRDGRNVNIELNALNLKKDQGETYAMQIVNQIQAGIGLLDKNIIINDAKREEAKQKLLFIAANSLKDLDNLGPETVKTYNAQIVSTMEKAGIVNSLVKLNFAKSLTTFQHEHMHITTLSNAIDKDNKSHTVVEAEIMLNGLTPKLKAQYEAVRDKRPIGADVTVAGANMDWYNKLPQFKKELLQEVADKIVSGQFVLPTPMLSVLPGVRNAYEKVTAVKSPSINELKIVSDNLHCGAPASGVKVINEVERQKIVDSNVQQLQTFVKDGKVNLNVLNSGVLGLDNVNEGYIFKQLKSTSDRNRKEEGKVNFSASPMNDWRKAPGDGRDHTKFKSSLVEIGDDLKNKGGDQLQKVGSYLKNGNKLGQGAKEALKELENYPNKELAKVLTAAVEARSLIDTPVTLEKSNVNLAVTNKMSIIETAMRENSDLKEITRDATRENIHIRVDFCKSGKDRTGYVETKNTHEAVSNYIGVSAGSDIGKANLLSQVGAGHTQEMAGIQGGTMGCHGIKQSQVFSLIKDDKGVDGILNRETANNNVIRMVGSKEIGAVTELFEKKFGEYKLTLKEDVKITEAVELSNYEKLQVNRATTLDFASKILPRREGDLINTGQLLADAKKSLKNANFEDSLQKLGQLKDAKLGIAWSENPDQANGTRALVRDARNVTLDPAALRHDAGEKYAMQILNEVRASLILVDKLGISSGSEKIEAKQRLMFIAENALDCISSNKPELSSKNVQEFNTFIIDTLDKAGVKNAAVELNFAKEMTNFKDEHRHIVTLTTAQDGNGKIHTVMEAEIMLNGLTPNQKKQYEMIATSAPGQRFGGDEIAWYNEMPKHRQDMLREVAGSIAEGNKVIPTQLLNTLIGVRNAYEKVTVVQTPGQPFEVISQSMHLGAPATKIKISGENLPKKEVKKLEQVQKNAIVQENIAQLQSFIEPSKRINLSNLTSQTPFDVRGEDFITIQLMNSKNNDVTNSASPINKWQIFGAGREQQEFNKTLKDIGKDLQELQQSYVLKNVSAISDFLQNGKSEKLAFQDIKKLKLTNPKLANILTVAISTKNLIGQNTNFTHSENINREISSNMKLIDNSIIKDGGDLNKVASEETKKNHSISINFCKSGKDRTGLVEMENTQIAVAQFLGIDPNSKINNDNKLRQVAGGHTQEMAGIQGGTIGCHSVKTNPEFGLNKSEKDIDGIINQSSAKFNSSIKVVENKKKVEVLEKFEAHYKSYVSTLKVPVKDLIAVAAEKPEQKQELLTAHPVEYQYPSRATTLAIGSHRPSLKTISEIDTVNAIDAAKVIGNNLHKKENIKDSNAPRRPVADRPPPPRPKTATPIVR